MNDNVNHPSHYAENCPVVTFVFNGETITVPVECIQITRNMPFWKGNAIKYIWRAGEKKDASLSDVDKEIEDLSKAIWYIKDRINELAKANGSSNGKPKTPVATL